MSKTATIQTRINPELKKKAQEILNTLNLSMSEAISLYLTQVTLHRGIPFDIRIPNDLTINTLEKTERGEELNEVSSVDELFQELEMSGCVDLYGEHSLGRAFYGPVQRDVLSRQQSNDASNRYGRRRRRG